jgi:hypothetical protein
MFLQIRKDRVQGFVKVSIHCVPWFLIPDNADYFSIVFAQSPQLMPVANDFRNYFPAPCFAVDLDSHNGTHGVHP